MASATAWPQGKPILAQARAKPSSAVAQAARPAAKAQAQPKSFHTEEEADEFDLPFDEPEATQDDEVFDEAPEAEDFAAQDYLPPQPKRAAGPGRSILVGKASSVAVRPVATAPASPAGRSFLGAAVRKRQLELAQGASPLAQSPPARRDGRPDTHPSPAGYAHPSAKHGGMPHPPPPQGWGYPPPPQQFAPPHHLGYGPPSRPPTSFGFGAQGHYPAAPHHMASPARPGKPSQQQAGWAAQKSPEPEVRRLNFDGEPVRWITIGEDSQLMQQGYKAMAPCVVHSPAAAGVMASVTYILHDLLGDDAASEIMLNHDPDWTVFPEVGDALKAAGMEETCYCLAICASQGQWAVGMGGQWKKREQATRLALAIALAANAESLSGLAAKYPDFIAMCQGAGVDIQDEGDAGGKGPPPMLDSLPAGYTPSKKRRKAAWKDEEAGESPAAPQASNGVEDSLPRDKPFWVQLPSTEATPVQLEGLPSEALAVSTDGGRKGLYSHVEAALALVIGESGDVIEYVDDANWDVLPEVGAALKLICKKEECMTVAICAARGLWAVGVGMKGKQRYATSKLAIATSLALQLLDAQTELDMSELPAFADFVEETRNSRGFS